MIKKTFWNFVIALSTLLNVLPTYGQRTIPILSKEQNQIWFDSLITCKTNKQLDLIRDRILSDTIVYNKNEFFTDRIILNSERKKQNLKSYGIIAEGRILYCLKYQNPNCKKSYKFRIIRWSNETEAQEMKSLHDFLTSEKIKDIQIMKDEAKEKAIYGSFGGYGIVTFNLVKKKYIRQYDHILTFNKPKT
jgi:predicted RNA-binding protein with PUA domain